MSAQDYYGSNPSGPPPAQYHAPAEGTYPPPHGGSTDRSAPGPPALNPFAPGIPPPSPRGYGYGPPPTSPLPNGAYPPPPTPSYAPSSHIEMPTMPTDPDDPHYPPQPGYPPAPAGFGIAGYHGPPPATYGAPAYGAASPAAYGAPAPPPQAHYGNQVQRDGEPVSEYYRPEHFNQSGEVGPDGERGLMGFVAGAAGGGALAHKAAGAGKGATFLAAIAGGVAGHLAEEKLKGGKDKEKDKKKKKKSKDGKSKKSKDRSERSERGGSRERSRSRDRERKERPDKDSKEYKEYKKAKKEKKRLAEIAAAGGAGYSVRSESEYGRHRALSNDSDRSRGSGGLFEGRSEGGGHIFRVSPSSRPSSDRRYVERGGERSERWGEKDYSTSYATARGDGVDRRPGLGDPERVSRMDSFNEGAGYARGDSEDEEESSEGSEAYYSDEEDRRRAYPGGGRDYTGQNYDDYRRREGLIVNAQRRE
ncbi:hypothetical protein BJ508DRAFT_77325 [Ascobolus immersus RN42]|uniref:Glycine zipper 2TM domain-containing protein n=1 Tax=Ascobolus immersus RN42 TaxID=1160509 RepID=A0A3N4IC23_ASCIM|nr:hypothetical protein BJ508DRAFT_77325 [Ascobolus immersus RN42]